MQRVARSAARSSSSEMGPTADCTSGGTEPMEASASSQRVDLTAGLPLRASMVKNVRSSGHGYALRLQLYEGEV